MQKSSFKLEKKLYKQGYDFVVGIDEAGRGPLAGPVVASAVALKNTPSVLRTSPPQRGGEEWAIIRDSKTLSEKQREKIHDFIMENFFVGVGICDHQTIDRMNILQASFLAMKKALTSLVSSIRYNVSSMEPENKKYIIHNTKYMILVDGDKEIPNFSGEQIAIPRGDQKVKSISAASIVAKVTRDRMMREVHKKYPRYGFDRHKGYGTKLHMEMLWKHGPCEIHRRSFKPVGKLLSNKNNVGQAISKRRRDTSFKNLRMSNN